MAVDAVGPEAGAPVPRRERVFTAPLVVLLALVAAVSAYAAWARYRVLPVAEAVAALADGDLDREERERALRAVVRGAAASSDPVELWAGLLAAVALDDRDGYAAGLARLAGDAGAPVPPPAGARQHLHLGDAVLGHVGEAMWVEAGGAPAAALAIWQQVEAQCRLAPHPLAAELAAAAIARLR